MPNFSTKFSYYWDSAARRYRKTPLINGFVQGVISNVTAMRELCDLTNGDTPRRVADIRKLCDQIEDAVNAYETRRDAAKQAHARSVTMHQMIVRHNARVRASMKKTLQRKVRKAA